MKTWTPEQIAAEITRLIVAEFTESARAWDYGETGLAEHQERNRASWARAEYHKVAAQVRERLPERVAQVASI